jgi:nucleoside-diphosphate-sugar epimerase
LRDSTADHWIGPARDAGLVALEGDPPDENRTAVMTTALVTGATGFVGGWLLDELLARGERVRALARDRRHVAALARRGVDVLVGDVCRSATLPAALPGVGVVYHCAAAVGPEKSAAEICATNRDGVRHLLEAARHAGLRFLGTSRWVDIRRARSELGFSPQIQFRDGLAETLVRAGKYTDGHAPSAHASR